MSKWQELVKQAAMGVVISVGVYYYWDSPRILYIQASPLTLTSPSLKPNHHHRSRFAS